MEKPPHALSLVKLQANYRIHFLILSCFKLKAAHLYKVLGMTKRRPRPIMKRVKCFKPQPGLSLRPRAVLLGRA